LYAQTSKIDHVYLGFRIGVPYIQQADGKTLQLANLESRYQRRLTLYRMAHISIPVDTLFPEQAVEQILSTLGLRCGKLEPS
jgi:hypothetical protein